MRGLKLKLYLLPETGKESHPTWVRGLKHQYRLWDIFVGVRVAPYVGAWIETAQTSASRTPLSVAPYVGAWIETTQHNEEHSHK